MDLTLSRKLSILSYLGTHGPVKLRDLAVHYGVDPKVIRQELRDLFLVELATSGGYECPIDLDFADDGSLDDYVALSSHTAEEFGKINLGFDELHAVLAWIDFLLPIADETQFASLIHLREQLTNGAIENGYASAIWRLPALTINRDVVNKLNLALTKQSDVRFDYWKTDEASGTAKASAVFGTPLELVALNHPLLHLQTNDALRTYRLDRISNVELIKACHNRKDLNFARAQLRKTKINFAGGTAVLYCDLKARWIAESYPGIQILQQQNELIDHTYPQTSLQLAVDYNNLSALLAILIRLGDSVKAISPTELADKIAERANILLERYRNES